MTGVPANRRRQPATGLGLSALALLVAFIGGLITPAGWLTPTRSPTFFPALALIGAALCGVFIAKSAPGPKEDGAPGGMHLRAIGMGALIGAYAIALPLAGLVLSTLILCLVLPLMLGYRNWAAVLALAVVIIASSWLVFIRLMSVPLKL